MSRHKCTRQPELRFLQNLNCSKVGLQVLQVAQVCVHHWPPHQGQAGQLVQAPIVLRAWPLTVK